MKYYEKLLEMGCFDRELLSELTGSEAAAKSLIQEYQKKGLIERVKRNLYAVISLETKQPVFSRYEIGTALFPNAYVSHHSAFEVYGYANQVFYECYVATDSRFDDFEYNGVTYHRVERRANADVATQGNIRVTSIEQTVVDSIRDFEKISGLEEVLRCIMLVPSLNEEKILSALEKNENGFLYQKCGYLFEQLRDEFRFTDHFFDICKEKSSGAKRYLIKDEGSSVLRETWKLYTPESLSKLTDKGMGDYDAIG